MSSAVVSTSAAPGRPFLFDAESEECCHPERSKKCGKCISCGAEESALSLPKGSLPSLDPRLASITPASRLEIRPAPEMVTSGIPALDALTGGLPRGCLTEICGPASSGRTSVMLAALASATYRGEYCAVIDASDALDSHSLAAAGIDLDRLLWVRCDENSPRRHPSTSLRAGRDTEKDEPLKERNSGSNKKNGFNKNGFRSSEHRLEQVLHATDLLLESGGFGMIILDLADVQHQAARRIPLTTWFRFRRAVEHKPTILLAIEQHPIAGSCSSLLLQLGSQKVLEKALNSQQSDSSRKAAAWESPARQCRVSAEERTESRRDGTSSVGVHDAVDHDSNSSQFANPSHANLLTELKINAELIRSRLDRKLARSITFETKTAWAG